MLIIVFLHNFDLFTMLLVSISGIAIFFFFTIVISFWLASVIGNFILLLWAIIKRLMSIVSMVFLNILN